MNKITALPYREKRNASLCSHSLLSFQHCITLQDSWLEEMTALPRKCPLSGIQMPAFGFRTLSDVWSVCELKQKALGHSETHSCPPRCSQTQKHGSEWEMKFSFKGLGNHSEISPLVRLRWCEEKEQRIICMFKCDVCAIIKGH